MELYLLRHGEADWPDWNKSDDERPLTKRGKKEMQEVAKFLGRLKVRPDLIVTSPLPRASQTAEIAADYLKAKVRKDELLAPGFGMSELRTVLKRLRANFPKRASRCSMQIQNPKKENFSGFSRQNSRENLSDERFRQRV